LNNRETQVTSTKTETATANHRSAFEFVIMRNVNAPRERVWRAWTEEESLGQWWGPKGFDIVSVKLDLRPGGTFHYLLRSPDGLEMWGKFIFREIVPLERLVFVVSFSDAEGGLARHPMNPDWPLTLLSTVTFADTGTGKTTVTVKWVAHEATDLERRTFEAGQDSMRQGWTGTFERLDAYLAAT
jgi:uncharacterized protein YndB with AHSA1/START domain